MPEGLNLAFCRAVEANFGLGECQWQQHRDIWHLKGLEKEWALKEIVYPEAEFAFIEKAMKHLVKNGFHTINRIYPTVAGENCFFWQGRRFFLSPWLAGVLADYDKPEDVKETAHTLARLHDASGGFVPPFFKGRMKWGELPANFASKLAQLEEWQKRAALTEEKSVCDFYVLQQAEYNLRVGEAVLRRLEPVYAEVNRQEEERGCFCHHDFAYHNVIISPAGVGQVIDFDYCICDTNCHDVASLLRRLLKCHDWEPEAAMLAWHEYNTLRPLTEAETEVVLAYLFFPQDFWQAAFTFYVEKGSLLNKCERRLRLWGQQEVARTKAFDFLADALLAGR